MIYHTPPPIIQEYVCGGGYTDKHGITWIRKGRYWATPEDAMKGDEEMKAWWPTVQDESAVSVDYLSDYPPRNKMMAGAWEEYERLLKITETYVVVIDGQKMLKGRMR